MILTQEQRAAIRWALLPADEWDAYASKMSEKHREILQAMLSGEIQQDGEKVLREALEEISRKKYKPTPGHYCEARSALDGAIKLADNALSMRQAKEGKSCYNDGPMTEFNDGGMPLG